MPVRRLALAALLPCLVAGCDLSPTAIDAMDDAELRSLLRRATPDGPARQVWLGLIEQHNGDAATAELPGLDSLFALSHAANASAANARSEHRRILDRAWRAIEEGDADEGQAALTAAREFQARTIVETLGENTPVVLLALVTHQLERLDPAQRYGNSGTDQRARAMAATARDLVVDAQQALRRGEPARALDLATHAAGLVNSLRRLQLEQ